MPAVRHSLHVAVALCLSEEMKLLYIKLPKKEHIENVAGKTSEKISLARHGAKRTFPDKVGAEAAKEAMLDGGGYAAGGSTTGHFDFSGATLSNLFAAGKAAGPGAALEGGVRGALAHPQGTRSCEYASTYESGVGRIARGPPSITSGSGGKKKEASTAAAGRDTGLKKQKEDPNESSFARTLLHAQPPRRPPRPNQGAEDLEDEERPEVRIGENKRSLARLSRRRAKKMLEEAHVSQERAPFDEKAALLTRRGEQEAFWRSVLKRNGHWVCGTSEVSTSAAGATSLVGSSLSTAASTSAAGQAPQLAGKEFNYGRLTLPGDARPKQSVRQAKPTCPWELEDLACTTMPAKPPGSNIDASPGAGSRAGAGGLLAFLPPPPG